MGNMMKLIPKHLILALDRFLDKGRDVVSSDVKLVRKRSYKNEEFDYEVN
jgi:hypothetical protein